MPISRAGKRYYTQEQYEKAVSYRNALEYAKSRGYEIIEQGKYAKLKIHDSLVFLPDGHFYWNSRQVGGGIMAFMTHVEGMSTVDAVLALAGDENAPGLPHAELAQTPQQKPKETWTPPEMPDKASDSRRLFGYLCTARGLDRAVVQEMIDQKILYQSREVLKNSGGIKNNAVFVYRNPETLEPVGGFRRGLLDIPGVKPYKRDILGSDGQYGWLLSAPIGRAETVAIFEASIDAASEASLDRGWREKPVDRLALEGLSFQPIENYLKRHPEVRTIRLMLDSDIWGRRAAARISTRLIALGYQVEDVIPPFGKDWNDVLVGTRSTEVDLRDTAVKTHLPTPPPEQDWSMEI